MRVIGTAGHVDHGKSALVQGLTGIDPDRLKEEKERKMTIDLGFAWGSLPGDLEVGYVDVPGHRDFIENMLAGVGGIDAALLVVAADEGVMPQTTEHLEIIDLLDVSHGVVALTKIDLVDDPDWLDLVNDEVESLVGATSLAGAPIIPVSVRSGEGMDRLRSALAAAVSGVERRPSNGRPRLPIDRAFSIAGFGTVVTGTLTDGSLAAGTDVVLLPEGNAGRIRGLQTHKHDVAVARPASRVAANVPGWSVDGVERGDVVSLPGTDTPTRRLLVHVRVLESSPTALEHNQQVKLFVGAAQRVARLRMLSEGPIAPGQRGFAMLRLRRPVVVRRADRYILRRPSPPATLAGGQVVIAHPVRLRGGLDRKLRQRLKQLIGTDVQDIVRADLETNGAATAVELVLRTNLPEGSVAAGLAELVEDGDIVALVGAESSANLYLHRRAWDEIGVAIRATLSKFHADHRLRSGMPGEELRRTAGISRRVFSRAVDALVNGGEIRTGDGRVRLAGFHPSLSRAEEEQAAAILSELRGEPYAPPPVSELRAMGAPGLFDFLVGRGDIVAVTPNIAFAADAYERMVARVRDQLAGGESGTVAELRDALGTSRKYALALLEHLDQMGVTVRKGDFRVLAQHPSMDE